MKVIGILNELYNNNKLENKMFKTEDGTILENTENLLDYIGISNNEWYSLTDLIETLQSKVEILEDEEPGKYLFEMIDDLYEEEKPKHIEELNIKDIYKCDDYQQIYINFKETWKKINELTKAVNYLLEKDK